MAYLGVGQSESGVHKPFLRYFLSIYQLESQANRRLSKVRHVQRYARVLLLY